MGHFDHCIWDRAELRSFLWLTAIKKMTGHREFGYLDAFHNKYNDSGQNDFIGSIQNYQILLQW